MSAILREHETALIPGTPGLIAELQQRLAAGESFDNPKLSEIADQFFGGTRAQGKYSPRDAYDAMETAVNRYLLENKAEELLAMDAKEALTGHLFPLVARLPRQTDRTTEQTEFQQFSTPPTLAYFAARLLDPQTTDVVLEPSAGTGSLAIWPRSVGARVICNEVSPRRLALLQTELGFETYSVDAEIIDDLLPAEIQPRAVLMNPPFSATGGRVIKHKGIYGAKHIESALCRLPQGGRLVAVTGESMGLDRSAFSDWWQRIARLYNVRANFQIDGKEYGKYGTNYDVRILVIDKTGPTPGENWQAQLGTIVWGEAANLEDAWAALEQIADRTNTEPSQHEDNEESRADSGTMFVPYVPTKLKGGKDHPAVIVESSSMGAVLPPDITYRPHLPLEVVTEGKLSSVQLERVIYAGQRHEQRLAEGERGGFYVGDGTGVGKGRILAGIIVDNWFQNRGRALWLSVNNDLLESTRRDLTDLGVPIPLARINDYSAAGEITLPQGVVFSSYSSLISTAKNGAKRLDQLERWLGTDGVIIFDEAHKAKNALAGGRGEPTLTGQAVIDLQDAKRNPEYRVVYSSATGATDVRNMAYMTRLGLWGKGTAFPAGFNEFLNEIEQGGVGAMEMVSRDLKSLGMYLSGSISFGVCPQSGKAVEYRERIHRLIPEQRKMYDHAAKAWQAVLKDIEAALGVTNGGNRARAVALNKFWGDHQRFFRQVICAFKVPSVIAETEEALKADKSVVISLIGTGEARTREQVAKTIAAGGMLEDLDFSPREIIAAMINRAFPTTLYRDVTDPATGKTIQVPVKDEKGNLIQSREALKMRQALIDGLSALELPENPLDQLINHFGEKNVAELTGRTRRLIRDPQSGRVEYRKRVPEGVAMDRANVYEMEQFQSGRKRIAIISDAASTGVSLHASNRAPNKQRRVHITLELGWSADKQMQTFGRTHRSDQAIPPEYVLLSTELAGEKRFSSTIARRLGSLGALTKGDRGAADAGDLAKYNFETEEGRAALSLMFRRIMKGESVTGLDNPRQTLRDIGLLVIRDGGEEVRKEDETNIPRFLNRLLALNVEEQNALFDYFSELFDQTLRHAKANGTFDEGVTDIKALAVRLSKSPRTVHTDKVTGAETTHYALEIDLPTKPVNFKEADEVRKWKHGAFFQNQKKGSFIMAIESSHHTDAGTGKTFQTFAVWKPEGARISYLDENDLNERYRVVSPEAARSWWTERLSNIPPIETSELHIIGGAIIPLWQRLKTNHDTQLKVVRVTTDDGQRIVGIQIPQHKVWQVLRSLGIGRTPTDPNQIFHAVLTQADQITLAAGLQLRQNRIHGETVIELAVSDPNKFAELREIGLINEQINWKQHFFVPTEEEKGIAILTRLLESYPVISTSAEDEEQTSNAESDAHLPISTSTIVDLEQWVIEPDESQTLDKVGEETRPPEKLFTYETEERNHRPQPSSFTFGDADSYTPSKRKQSPRKTVDSQMAFDFMEIDSEETGDTAAA